MHDVASLIKSSVIFASCFWLLFHVVDSKLFVRYRGAQW